MHSKILFGKSGADEASGVAVIIDVFRAATTASYAFGSGVEYIIPVADTDEAFALKSEHPDFVLTGEVGGIHVEGFDFGNSPFQLSEANLQGKILVQRTSSGTQGLVRSSMADVTYFGGFPTFSATLKAILKQNQDFVSIVAMAGEGTEDDIYAQCLQGALNGVSPDWIAVREMLKRNLNAQRFFDPEKHHSPLEDFDLCVTPDVFSFAIRLERGTNGLRLVKEVTS